MVAGDWQRRKKRAEREKKEEKHQVVLDREIIREALGMSSGGLFGWGWNLSLWGVLLI